MARGFVGIFCCDVICHCDGQRKAHRSYKQSSCGVKRGREQDWSCFAYCLSQPDLQLEKFNYK